MAKENEVKTPQRQRKLERIMDPDKMDYFYSTCSFIRSSVQDFAISFGVACFDDPHNKITEVYEKTIHMSPQQTKIFFNTLKGLLDNYEETFGKIQIDIKKKK